ncbi:MAG: hypothetical protein JXA96_15365 [Sedimentisphaerales bacterium]|nr:hypothetical protein [Sedimentisphaerales bacterium]
MRKDNIKCRKLYSLLFVFFVACICNSQVFAMDIMGPPTAEHEQGWFDIGIEYSHTKMDIDLYNGYYTDFLDGALYDWGDAQEITFKDLKINRTYVRFGYGITDNAEVFLRLGGLNAKFGDTIWEDSEKFSSSAELAAGAGVKLTFYDEGNLKLGGLFQFSTASFDGQLESPNWLTSDFVEVEMTEVQIALGASCKCNENLTIYGGPFLHFINGDISDNMSVLSTSPAGLLTSEFEWDIEQSSVFGGCIGAQISFSEQSSFNIEYQQTADASTFGMGLVFKF